MGGATPGEGRVELCKNNVWGTVCDDYWDSPDASVACRQLGFSPQGATAFVEAHFGEGAGPVWLANTYCVGTESSLTDCRNNTYGPNYCRHTEDAGIRCKTRKLLLLS